MFNVFPSVKGRDFRPPEADVPARDEDIDSGVDVPVMPSTTSTTDPVPYYEAFSTFWAAACTARGTDLRGQMLINLEVLSPVPHGLVVELGSKLRPAGIEDGLRQAGSGESAGIDVADANAPILPHEPGGQIVQEVLPTVRDLRVDGPHAELAPGTLRDGELSLVSAVNAWRLDLLTRGKGRQRLEAEAEVDADLASPMVLVFEDRYLQIEVPAAAGVLSKATAADLPCDATAEPEPVPASEKDYRVPLHANRTRGLERDPPQGLPAAPPRPLTMSISRNRKLLADRLHGIRVQAKKLAAAAGELDQIEARGPAFVVSASGFLGFATEVPHAVYRPGLPLEVPTGGRILDPVAVGQHHVNIVVDRCCENKPDAKNVVGIFTLDQTSAVPGLATLHLATRLVADPTYAPTRRSRTHRFLRLSSVVRVHHRAPPARPERRGFRRAEFT